MDCDRWRTPARIIVRAGEKSPEAQSAVSIAVCATRQARSNGLSRAGAAGSLLAGPARLANRSFVLRRSRLSQRSRFRTGEPWIRHFIVSKPALSSLARMPSLTEASTRAIPEGTNMDSDQRRVDIDRISKLRALATSGVIGGQSSYFNHLIAIYGKIGMLTARERARVDLFLALRGK